MTFHLYLIQYLVSRSFSTFYIAWSDNNTDIYTDVLNDIYTTINAALLNLYLSISLFLSCGLWMFKPFFSRETDL